MAVSSQIQPNLNTYETGYTPGAQGDIGLTTVFTPPSTCLDVVTYDGTSFWQGGLLQTGDQDCYPPRFLDIFWSQYTPGICPQGLLLSFDVGFLQHACASVFGTPLTNVFSTSSKGVGPIPQNADLITIDPGAVQSNTVYADIIGIHWAATDSPILRLMSQTSKNSPTAAGTAAQTAQGPPPLTSPTAPAASTSTPQAGGISEGAWAGIGIAAVIAIMALAVFACFLWRRRRNGSNVGSSNEGAPPQYRARHELDSEPAEIYPRSRVELSPMERAELPPDGLSMKKAHGFPAKGQMSELATDLAIDRKTMWVSPISTISPRSPSQQQTPRYFGNALL
ncbi:MAG: hypothetical protein Q9205_001768 [Flavoplaca limonia]